ncbi:MAG TPA: integrase core domain-containing protein [Candidatus Nanoarchaeia archaeon]|nr:integrase core domain-containing protein [Candidatus Nanoarchaeia archaeon]
MQQYRKGRSPSSIAKIQHISRQYVYNLVEKYKDLGELAYEAQKPGRPKVLLNPAFVKRVITIREEDDYGSEKIHFVLAKEGFSVSQRQIQRILDEQGLTEPCINRRGQRSYVRYQWPLSNYMWHSDWSEYKEKQYVAFIDDRSRKIMAGGEFSSANKNNTCCVFYQAMLTNNVCPVVVLTDKGTQFYANKKTSKGERALSEFENELRSIGIELWTSRRNHPQTNGKMEKWFDTFKKRNKKHPKESFQDFIKWYNEKRIHHALEYKTPDEVYLQNL